MISLCILQNSWFWYILMIRKNTCIRKSIVSQNFCKITRCPTYSNTVLLEILAATLFYWFALSGISKHFPILALKFQICLYFSLFLINKILCCHFNLLIRWPAKLNSQQKLVEIQHCMNHLRPRTSQSQHNVDVLLIYFFSKKIVWDHSMTLILHTIIWQYSWEITDTTLTPSIKGMYTIWGHI